MKLFFAGTEADIINKRLVASGMKKAMYSFYYIRDAQGNKFKKRQASYDELFIDSGGFSARVKGVNIKITDYADYLKKVVKKKNKKLNLIYANLDVTSVKDTLYNQKYLESQGLNPLPVYHASDYFQGNKKLLLNYIKKYDYIAAGGVSGSGYSAKQVQEYFDFIFTHTKDKIKIHGFGVTAINFLNRYPFYSVDSTSWNQGMLYGMLARWDARKLCFTNSHYTKNDKNLDNRTIISDVSDYKARASHNIKQYLKMEKTFNSIWKARGITW